MACFVFAQCLLAAVQGRPSAPPPARRRDQVRPPAVCRAPWRGAVTPDGRTACCSPSRQRRRKKKRERCSFCQICPFSLSCIHWMALSVCRGGSARPKQSRGCGSLQPRELFPFSLESGLVRPPAGAGLASHFSKMQIQHCICNSVRLHGRMTPPSGVPSGATATAAAVRTATC